MSELSLNDLKTVMREVVGEDDVVDLDQDILDVPFVDLAPDSLALMETAALIKRRTGVATCDDEFDEFVTPRALLVKVTGLIAAAT